MREIRLTVRGDTVHASRDRAGVQGEANAAALVVSFDESWDGYAKTITFWDAYGENPVVRTLTVDLLVDAANDTRTYQTTIPGEPMALAGECVLVIDGYKDGARARSMSVRLTVEEAPVAENAGEPADPTPTQAEQLQVQIEAIMGDIQKAVQAAGSAERAQEAASAAGQSAKDAALSEEAANNSAANASASEQGAAGSAKRAQEAVALAEGYTSHPPVIGANENWYQWDGSAYVDTGLPSRGRGEDGYTPVRGVDYWTPEDKQGMVSDVIAQTDGRYANALTATAQGTQLLRLEDVSPLAGQLDINVSGVDDPTAVKVTVCGSNLCDEAFVYGIIAGEDNPTYRRWVFDLPAGTYTYCFAQEVYMQEATVDTQIMRKTCATFTTPGGEQSMQFRMSVNGTSWDESNHLMVVPGIYTQDTMPAYEPYTGTSVTPQQDGSCRAAASGTALTVLADTPGAVITCTYPRDINKAFEQLTQVILSLGGNI